MESDLATELERGVGQRLAGGVNAGPADRGFRDVELEGESFLNGAEHLDGFAHYFGTDAVAGECGELESL
jgi:hypothetical protein